MSRTEGVVECKDVHFLILAFGYPQFEHSFFWTCIEREPAVVIIISDYSLDPVEGVFIIPQRLHRTCVLLWRLPKLEVPFAVHFVSICRSYPFSWADMICHTHFDGLMRRAVVVGE